MDQNAPSDVYLDQLRRTRERFALSLSGRLDAITTQIETARDGGMREAASRKLHRLFHDLAGNAAMLDLASIEAAMRDGLHFSERADREGRDLTTQERTLVGEAIERTRRLADVLVRDLPAI